MILGIRYWCFCFRISRWGTCVYNSLLICRYWIEELVMQMCILRIFILRKVNIFKVSSSKSCNIVSPVPVYQCISPPESSFWIEGTYVHWFGLNQTPLYECMVLGLGLGFRVMKEVDPLREKCYSCMHSYTRILVCATRPHLLSSLYFYRYLACK